MSEKKRGLANRLQRIDRHEIGPEEYDDIPEVAEGDFARAEFEIGGKPIGRPRLDRPKVPISLRLDQEIVDAFKSTGPGWQTRMNDTLRKVVISGGPKEQTGTPRSGGSSVNHRSAKTGQFVTEKRSEKNPSATVAEKGGGAGNHGAHRSAVSGEFVNKGFAKSHPGTTMKDISEVGHSPGGPTHGKKRA